MNIMKIPKIYSIAFFSTIFFSCGDNIPSSNSFEGGGNQSDLPGNTGGASGGVGGGHSDDKDLVAGRKILKDAEVQVGNIKNKYETRINSAEWKVDIDRAIYEAGAEISVLITTNGSIAPDILSRLSSENECFNGAVNAMNNSLASLSVAREASLMNIPGNLELKEIIDAAIDKLNKLKIEIRAESIKYPVDKKMEPLSTEMKKLLEDLEKSLKLKIKKGIAIDERLLGRERFDSLYKWIEEQYFSKKFAQTFA